jgi:hypothetical protein
VSTKYPTKETFAADLPNILKTWIYKEMLQFTPIHLTVEPLSGQVMRGIEEEK